MDPLDPDEELVLRAQKGDRKAFDVLFERHHERIRRLCARLLGDPDDGDQVAQEAFVRAWRALPQFQRSSRFYTWLYLIAKNCCMKFLSSRSGRDDKFRVTLDDLDTVQAHRPRGADNGVEDTVVSSVLAEHLLQQIPVYARTAKPRWDAFDFAIFYLLYADEVETARECARLLKRKEHTVADRIRKHIRPVLKQVYENLRAEEAAI